MTLRRTTREDYAQRLLRAEQLLEQRLDESISPLELARAASFSLHNFHRIFRGQLGESVMQRVRRLRLERAARRIRSADLRLIDIAFEAGYESHEAFTRAFADQFSVPPSEYREQPSLRLATWVHQHAEQPKCQVTIQHYPVVHVAFMRHHGSYDNVGETWRKVVGWSQANGLLGGDFRVLYGICPDDTDVTPEPHLRFDAAVVTQQGFDPGPGLGVAEIPAGTYAVGLHVGGYDRLRDTYLDVVGRWFPDSGYEPAAEPVIEHYLDDPTCTPEAQLQTEVRVKIAD